MFCNIAAFFSLSLFKTVLVFKQMTKYILKIKNIIMQNVENNVSIAKKIKNTMWKAENNNLHLL